MDTIVTPHSSAIMRPCCLFFLIVLACPLFASGGAEKPKLVQDIPRIDIDDAKQIRLVEPKKSDK